MGSRQEKRSKSPLVSVIMCVYNGGNHVSESIESILSQSLADFEFIIINDGSTDNTGGLIEDYSKIDPRIITVHQDNKGLTKSLNLGIKLARGRFIARQDADDISDTERLKRQIEFLMENEDYRLVGTGCAFISESGEVIGEKIFSSDWEKVKLNALKETQFSHPSIVVEKEALLSVGLYNEKFEYGQDYELWLRFLDKYKGVNIPDVLIRKRISMDGIGMKHRRIRMFNAGKAAIGNVVSRKKIQPSDLIYISMFFIQYLIPDSIWNLLRRIKGKHSLSWKSSRN